MHDIKLLRADPDGFDRDLRRRGLGPSAADIGGWDEVRRSRTSRLQQIEARRNVLARQIGSARRTGQDSVLLEEESTRLKADLALLGSELSDASLRQQALLEGLPNRLDPGVPDGADEHANVERHRHGAIAERGYPARQHFELGEALGLMDFEAAGRIAGSRFTVLRGALARLERALGQFMIDLHVAEHGYEEVSVPTLVNAAALHGTGQLPKFADDLFRTTDERYLIPTAEVPLTNLAAGQILPASAVPLRLAALTECYRAEAGSAGRDTRGMLRQHQFRKVELVSIVAPEESEAEHERMTRAAETVLERLGLPYRRMLLCAGDTGFSAARTYDLEVWLPGQEAWREISSCSNCREFQARRMNARLRGPDGRSIRVPHTLNGSGVAVGRALIAVMENGQRQDGGIAVPDALRPYMAGLEVIRRG